MHSFKLLFSAISMSTTRPLSDGDGRAQWTKVSKKPFCCQNGSDWSWWGERDHQKHLFPLQKTLQTHQHIFFFPVSFRSQVRRKYRNEQRGGERTEEWKQRKQVWVVSCLVVCLSFTLSAGSQQMGSSVGGAASKRLKDSPLLRPSTLPRTLPYSSRGGVEFSPASLQGLSGFPPPKH